jgi:hypothetical protein
LDLKTKTTIRQTTSRDSPTSKATTRRELRWRAKNRAGESRYKRSSQAYEDFRDQSGGGYALGCSRGATADTLVSTGSVICAGFIEIGKVFRGCGHLEVQLVLCFIYLLFVALFLFLLRFVHARVTLYVQSKLILFCVFASCFI